MVKISSIATFLSTTALASAVELTPDNWDSVTAGKTVFIKFFAPWCGHCKKMKPDWDKLMGAFEGSETQLIADVDCTADGKPLCDANGVKGFPTLKWGDPSDLQDYQGGRDYDTLEKFAKEKLKPMCSPKNIDLCDDEKKKEIEKFQVMDKSELEALIKEKEDEQAKVEEEFKKLVEGLQKTYTEANEDKDKKLAEIKESGLGLMKAVLASGGGGAAVKEEL